MAKLKDEGTSAKGPFAGMAAGEVRSFVFRNGQARTIQRTKRPFIYDWVDATNEEQAAMLRSLGMVWMVDAIGIPQLVSTKYAKHMGRKAIGKD